MIAQPVIEIREVPWLRIGRCGRQSLRAAFLD